MNIISSFIVLVIILFTSCFSSKPDTDRTVIQVIEIKSQFYDTVGNQFSRPFMALRQKIWYRDSIAIEEVCSLYVVTDTADIRTEEVVVMHFRFSDLRIGSVYEYKNFSDTAGIIRKYSYNDTVQITGGWNFKFIRKLNYNGTPENLPDTIIDKISYKRVRLSRGTQDNPFTMICYFRCDKKGTIFTSDHFLSEMMEGCPLVKKYNFSLLQKGAASSVEINFLSDTLTEDESKVFAVWEKNARNNPVN